MKKILLLISTLIILLAIGQSLKLFPEFNFGKYLKLPQSTSNQTKTPPLAKKQTVVYEESIITKVVEESLPSVVTIGISKVRSTSDSFQFNPFDPFNPLRKIPGKKQKIEQNIGSGFIISPKGLIITNKHVVADTEAQYKVLTNNKKTYLVEKIYRDPLNDLAILKINPLNNKLKPLKLGDSLSLKLGQLAIAIGTPLGQFTNTVTSGIISGLGRGIKAGSPFEGYVEKLNNVIQTDAAINPGNSGGPLLNSSGQVIGINTAIAQEGQNIGFAIPVNVVKELVNNFNKRGGRFERPYIGVRYKMIDKQTAILNEVVEGAYVVQVVENSPAEKAGIEQGDIIIEINNKRINGSDEQSLAKLILKNNVGDKINLKIWKEGKVIKKSLTLEAFK